MLEKIIDNMEYSSNTSAQEAYVSDAVDLRDDAYTKLLVHFDGTDGATALTATTGQVLTFVGTAQLDTAQKKLGSAALLLDGNSDYVTVPDSEDWNYGTGDFTIDCYIYVNSADHDFGICGQYVDADNFWELMHVYGGQTSLYCKVGGVITVYYAMEPYIFTPDTWIHLAFVRHGSTGYLFLNGVSQNAVHGPTTGALPNLAAPLSIGYHQERGYLNGSIDEFRISKGVARWTANFTPPDHAHVPLKSLSEATYKTQGSYSLGICSKLGSLISSNAVSLNEDFLALSSWTDEDTSTGETTQVEFKGYSCAKFNSGATTSSVARIIQDIGSFSSRTVFSLKIYCDAISARADSDAFAFQAYNGTKGFTINFASDGLFVYHNSSWVEIGTDLVVQDTWQEWTFDVDWTNAIVDIYLNGVLVAADQGCNWSYSTITDGNICFTQNAETTATRITYVDFIKVGIDVTYTETSLKRALTKILSTTVDLSNLKFFNFDIRSNYTGSNFKLSFLQNASIEDAYTKLLMHCDGTTGDKPSTATTGQTITYNGTAQVDTTFKKFGSASLLLDGDSDYLTIPDSDDWDINADTATDYTIDCWVRITTVPTGGKARTICSQQADTNNGWQLMYYNYGGDPGTGTKSGFIFRVYASGSNVWQFNGAINAISLNVWHHIAMVKINGTCKMFIDGNLYTFTEVIARTGSTTSAAALSIGYGAGFARNGDGYFIGSMDEFHITKGVARWTYNFTPPTRQHGKWIEFTPSISTANVFETKLVDISSVADADKNAISVIHIQPLILMSQDITAYIDNIGATTDIFGNLCRRVSPNTGIVSTVS